MESLTGARASPPLPPTTLVDTESHDLTSLTTDKPLQFDKTELLRQVEYYFSDENLQSDAHLLGKLQEGNGTVSVSQVSGWKCMRQYRPLSAFRDALKESTVIEVINNKRIKRRQPFDMAKAKVAPKIDEEEKKLKQTATLKANPHLSKGMLKRTGFEHDFVEPGLSNEDQQAELEQYSTQYPICERIETAILRFKMNRKFHQETMKVFHAFLNFAGFDERPSGFTGGTSKEEEEGLSKEEKARRKQVNYVSKEVIQSLEQGDGKWIVDFEGVTKGFFSTHFSEQFLFHDDLKRDKEVTNATCNVLCNFFNYLLYHNVCAEYTDQVHAAVDALKVIETEVDMLAEVQQVFPGAFSVACSTLTGGYYAKIHYQGTWMSAEEAAASKVGLSKKEAEWLTFAGISAFGTHSQIGHLMLDGIKIVKTEEDVSLEVAGIVRPTETSDEEQKFFSKLEGTMVKPMGKLICKRYHFQKSAPLDLPTNYPHGKDLFAFVVDEDTLQKCYLGLKFIATVKDTNIGLSFIDHRTECYGAFYTWCWNEKARDCKEYSDPFELAKPKDRPTHGDVVPLGEDRMLENGHVSDERETSSASETGGSGVKIEVAGMSKGQGDGETVTSMEGGLTQMVADKDEGDDEIAEEEGLFSDEEEFGDDEDTENVDRDAVLGCIAYYC